MTPVALAGVVAAVLWFVRRRRLAASAPVPVGPGLPDAIDLLRLGAEADLTVMQAMVALADHGLGPLGEAAGVVVARTHRGVRLADALESLRIDPVTSPLTDALIDAERYGTPLVRSLERLGIEARRHRQHVAQERARRLPVRLLVPLVVCALPAAVVLAVVPVVVVSVEGILL